MSEKIFSARLSEAIKASGLTQTEIAKKAGITAPYLSDLKKGNKGNPSQDVLKALADSLGTTPAWLMSYKDAAGISVVVKPEPSVDYQKAAEKALAVGIKKLESSQTETDPELAIALDDLHTMMDMATRSSEGTALVMIDGCHKRIDDFSKWAENYRRSNKSQS